VTAASTGSPAPAAAPTAATSHTLAAVVSPRTDEADAADDLRRHPRRVQHDVPAQHVGEAVLADQHEQRRAEADQGVGAQRQAQRDREFGDLRPALAGRFAEGERRRTHRRRPYRHTGT